MLSFGANEFSSGVGVCLMLVDVDSQQSSSVFLQLNQTDATLSPQESGRATSAGLSGQINCILSSYIHNKL